MMPAMSMAPGWYPDPFYGAYLRWWDGSGWTSTTRLAERVAPPPAQPPRPAETPPPPSYQPPWAGWTPYPLGPPPAPFALAPWGSRLAARLVDWMLIVAVMTPVYVLVLWPSVHHLISALRLDGSSYDSQLILQFQQQVV